jgi:radical SAM superfamily enzyme YgiQ (UPF0313 family)
MNSQRILLINPTMASKRAARFPLAALSLAAALEGRYGARIIDGNVDRDFVATARAAVCGGGFDAVGISVMGGPQLQTAVAVSKGIRAVAPATPIIWGGYFPTICPDAALNSSYVDYAVRGQGEATFVELLDALFAGGHDALGHIAGLSWRQSGGIAHNGDRAFSTLGLGKVLP